MLYALLAAVLYALSTPFSKKLLTQVSPDMMAALLYLGAGLGMSLLYFARKAAKKERPESRLGRSDAPFVLLMIALDIAAPILLMNGLSTTAAENVSLLNNFEIVATSLIAYFFFREKIGKRLLISIALVTVASALLSFEGAQSLAFSKGSVLALLATLCWGLENNCTRRLSGRDPLQIVVLKGFGSGGGALIVALLAGERLPDAPYILCALALGFVAYGLSIYFYIRAQRALGAARTSVWYAAAPFIGAFLSLALTKAAPNPLFWPALALMGLGMCLATFTGSRPSGESNGTPE